MNRPYRIYYKKKDSKLYLKSFWDKNDLFKQVSENFFDTSVEETVSMYHIRHVKNIASNLITKVDICLNELDKQEVTYLE